MRYVPYHELGGEPNIVVDGAAAAATRLTLSHWPRSGTPAALKDDLSAQVVFRYLDRPDLHVAAEAVSNNHFDEDGLVSVYAMTRPEEAQGSRERLVDVAAAGDFGTYRFRESARVAFAISGFCDPRTSPLGPTIFSHPHSEQSAALYRELLPRLPEMLHDLDAFHRLWETEDDVLSAGEEALAGGKIHIEEVPSIDLAVVILPEVLPERAVHRFTQGRHAVCHPMAIHNATRRFRILLMQGRRYELQYRYETWVQYVSRRPAPRVDLGPLARRLSREEREGRWVFDGVEKITPKLWLDGASDSHIPPDRFRQEVEGFLATAPPAWDPFDAA